MKLCLGTVQFGVDYGIQGNGKPNREKAYEMLSYAIENGVDTIDTACAYGDAEIVIGDYFRLHSLAKQKVEVISKLKPDAFDNTISEEWSNIAIQNARESLSRLGIDKLDAYLFHNAHYIYDDKAVLALLNVKKYGLAKKIGVSIYSPEEAMKALEYSEIGVIQIPYNILDHRLDKCAFFEKAKKNGVQVFARSTLLQGLIMMDTNTLPERVLFAKEYIIKFRDICDNYGKGLLETAIGYVSKKDGIDHIVFGADNIRQLNEFINYTKSMLSQEMIDTIDKTFEDVDIKLVNPVLWK